METDDNAIPVSLMTTYRSVISKGEKTRTEEDSPESEKRFKRSGEEERLQYLAVVQSVIERMANCSFSIKAGCIAVLVGIIALEAQQVGRGLLRQAISAVLVCMLFSFFDARYLQQEHRYRILFKQIVRREDYRKEMMMPAESKEEETCFSAVLVFLV